MSDNKYRYTRLVMSFYDDKRVSREKMAKIFFSTPSKDILILFPSDDVINFHVHISVGVNSFNNNKFRFLIFSYW